MTFPLDLSRSTETNITGGHSTVTTFVRDKGDFWIENLEQIVTKLYHSRRDKSHFKFGKNLSTWAFWANEWNKLSYDFSDLHIRNRSFDGFWRLMAQNMRNRAKMYREKVKKWNLASKTSKPSQFDQKLDNSHENIGILESKWHLIV